MTDDDPHEGGGYPHLERLVSNEQLWAHFENFDRILDEQQKRLPSLEHAGESALIARQLHTLAYEHFYLVLVFRFKAREIARGILAAASTSNTTVVFNLARAFVEHTASLAYQDNSLRAAVQDITGKQGLNQLKSVIVNHRRNTERMYYGGHGSPIEAKRIHVNDLINKLQDTYQSAQADYEKLCEFVHPNYGSNKLVSSGTLAAGLIGTQTDWLSEDNALARRIVEGCAIVGEDLVLSQTASLVQLDSWITIASQPGVKLSQLSVRGASEGDGKTRDTAISFKKARTHAEAIQAFYKYIQDNGLDLVSRQQHGVENGFLFDICQTDKGVLWVKYKIMDY